MTETPCPTVLKYRRLLFRVTGGCGRQADGTAGLSPASEMPGAFRYLRFRAKSRHHGRRPEGHRSIGNYDDARHPDRLVA